MPVGHVHCEASGNAAILETVERLPVHIQRLADKNFLLLKADPDHPSLNFKKINDMWSARVGINYRALAFEYDNCILWFWIGSHAEYDKLMQ